MADVTLRSASTYPPYDLRIDVREVDCLGISSRALPSLQIPITIHRPAQSEPSLLLHLIGGRLLWQGSGREELVATLDPRPLGRELGDGSAHSMTIEIAVTHSQVEAIEVLRNLRDAYFQVELWIMASYHDQSPHGALLRNVILEGKGTFHIPKSTWIDRVYSPITARDFHLLQIPITKSSNLAFLTKAFEELARAEQNLERDYQDVVSDCRRALDPLINEARTKSDKEHQRDQLKQWTKDLIGDVSGDSAAEYIANQLHEAWGLTSRPHHNSRTYHRRDAILVLANVGAMLGYIADALDTSSQRSS